LPYKDPEKRRQLSRNWRKNNLEHCRKAQASYYRKNPVIYLLSACRQRCRKNNVPYNLEKGDISIPANCPVLGIPLLHGSKPFHDNSPSIDRLIPEKGYVKGNVRVISFRANKIKQDATLEEIEKVAAWLRRELAEVAQPAEQEFCKLQVAGANPAFGSISVVNLTNA
jgi:hypothetical protein